MATLAVGRPAVGDRSGQCPGSISRSARLRNPSPSKPNLIKAWTVPSISSLARRRRRGGRRRAPRPCTPNHVVADPRGGRPTRRASGRQARLSPGRARAGVLGSGWPGRRHSGSCYGTSRRAVERWEPRSELNCPISRGHRALAGCGVGSVSGWRRVWEWRRGESPSVPVTVCIGVGRPGSAVCFGFGGRGCLTSQCRSQRSGEMSGQPSRHNLTTLLHGGPRLVVAASRLVGCEPHLGPWNVHSCMPGRPSSW
jgi:hypothetical protein